MAKKSAKPVQMPMRSWEDLDENQRKLWLETESEFAQKQKRRLAYRDDKSP